MKYLLFILTAFFTLSVSSCSQCYECTSQSLVDDGNGNVIDTTFVTNDICTSSSEEITDREASGEVCVVQ